MTIHYRIIEKELIIVGHTYPHKELIKALGARFDRNDKAWKLALTESNQNLVDQLCRQHGGGLLGAPPITSSIETTLHHSPAVFGEGADSEQQGLPHSIQIEGLTVSELVHHVDMAVRSAFPRAIWVIGEIQNMTERNLGLFFQISEQKSGNNSSSATVSVKANLWNNVLVHLQDKFTQRGEEFLALLADGMQARLLCQVNLYKDRAQISLNVLDVDPSFTKGALALAREALLRELRKQGLDQKNKQHTQPAFPFLVGLISAEGSRAKSDFLDQLATYRFPGEVLFCDARMQGENTPKEVISGIDVLMKADVDIIVITRGGGSAADLRWFDDRDVAFAIANATVPIVAAIGHHDDVCVAEEIAFQREKTPTAAADFILHCFQVTRVRINLLAENFAIQADRRLEWHERFLQQMSERLTHGILTQLNRQSDQLALFTERISNSAKRFVERQVYMLSNFRDRLHASALSFLQGRLTQLSEVEKKLLARDPMPWIKKGWTQLFGKDGNVLSVGQISQGDQLRARLTDGQIFMKVEGIQKDIKNGKR